MNVSYLASGKVYLVCFLISVFLLVGCAKIPYEYNPSIETPNTLKLRAGEAQIERGKPQALVDGLGHYLFSLPSKLILFNWDVENHNISPATEQLMVQYLEDNALKGVKVRLNQYAPGGEWSRLVRNRSVGGFWRYTFGVLSVTFYTIWPGRLFGGDHYNPYTNTISLYSDHSAIVLHEAGHAKDFAEKEWKGMYSFIGLFPLVSLYHEAEASGDALGYMIDKKLIDTERDAYKVLYPAYCTYIGGEARDILDWFSLGNELIYLGAVIPGHIIGRIRSALVDDAPECSVPAEEGASGDVKCIQPESSGDS